MSKLTPEDVVLRYSKRGMNILKKYLKDGYCRTAAEKLLHAERGTVLLTTGFYVAGYAETDGPLGTVAVAEALNHLGFHSIVVTDKYCKGFFELKQLDVEYVDIAADEQVYEDILDKYKPVYISLIEGCVKTLSMNMPICVVSALPAKQQPLTISLNWHRKNTFRPLVWETVVMRSAWAM